MPDAAWRRQIFDEMEELHQRSTQQSKSDASIATCSVMLVDDNEALLQVLRESLKHLGITVNTYLDATSALAALRIHAPDCIICDIAMPGMDGYEFHKQVRSSPDWSNIPFIFLTGLSDAKNIRGAKELGCDDYLTKPIDPVDLVAVVRGKLSLARERESLVETRLETYRRRIVHTLSHEFRTPLVAINTGTEILLEQMDSLDPARVAHLLGSIKRGGQRLQRLVDDFMLLQQIDSGVAQTTYERLHGAHSLNEIAENAVRLYEEGLDHEKPRIALKLAADKKLTVDVYDVHVIDLIRRLLSNAHKFGGTIQPVEVWTACSDGTCSIVVRDFGPGMTDQSIEQICKRFTQIDRERMEQQGCGIGLSIAQYFAELNCGKLLFERAPGGGLQVEARFPTKI